MKEKTQTIDGEVDDAENRYNEEVERTERLQQDVEFLSKLERYDTNFWGEVLTILDPKKPKVDQSSSKKKA